MDPSTSTAQDVQNQNSDDQPVNQAQPVISIQQTPPPKTQISVPGGVEAGSSVIVEESPNGDEDDEDELKVAPQETKTQVVGQRGGADIQEEVVELQPSVPEVVTSSVEVEKVIEKSPDLEKPNIPKAVQDAGVTHSGLGVIAVEQNTFGVKAMPVTYQQAAVEEKVTELHDSKHWLMGMVMYIWRKMNPKLGKKGETELKNEATVVAAPLAAKKAEIKNIPEKVV